MGLFSLMIWEMPAGTDRVGVVSALVTAGAVTGGLLVGVELDSTGMTGSLTGASSEGLDMDCLLDLSLLKTRLALLMNLAKPLGCLSSGPPEPPWPVEVILVEGC